MASYVNFGLCAGRHELPCNTFIFNKVKDPMDFQALYEQAMEILAPYAGQHIAIYVTGLSTLLGAVTSVCANLGCSLVLKHYDRNLGAYKPQFIF